MNIALISISALRNTKEATRITILSLAQELINLGHTAVVIGEKASGYPNYEKIGDVSLYRFGFPVLSKLFFPARAVHTLQKKMGIQFDIIHGFSSTPLFVLSSVLAKRYSPKSRVIHTLRSYSRKRGGNMFYSLLNLADQITVPSKVFATKLKSISPEKLAIIHSWVDISKFRPFDKKQLKKKYGYEGKKIVFHYGAMWRNKGTEYLIRAIPLIVQEQKEVHFLFAPRYSAINDLQDLVDKLQISTYVTFITSTITIEEYVTMADVVVLPYVSLQGTEGNPSCLLEAMACKTTVVTTNLPELQEVTANSVLFANPSDIHTLARQISIAFNPNPKMIEQAYQKAQEFGINLIASRIIRLYRKN